MIHDALGEKAPALTELDRACEKRAVEFAQMKQYPAFTAVAAEPRYQAQDFKTEIDMRVSSAMPHLGHAPGPFCRTSWSMGQMYSRSISRRTIFGTGMRRRPR